MVMDIRAPPNHYAVVTVRGQIICVVLIEEVESIFDRWYLPELETKVIWLRPMVMDVRALPNNDAVVTVRGEVLVVILVDEIIDVRLARHQLQAPL